VRVSLEATGIYSLDLAMALDRADGFDDRSLVCFHTRFRSASRALRDVMRHSHPESCGGEHVLGCGALCGRMPWPLQRLSLDSAGSQLYCPPCPLHGRDRPICRAPSGTSRLRARSRQHCVNSEPSSFRTPGHIAAPHA
jgi:hypothetical protein